MKKYIRSKVAIACYIIAALLLVYFVTLVISTVNSINQYYAAYGMQANFSEVLAYLLQNGLSPLVSAVTVFMAGYILDAVRKLDPANWVTVEEPAAAEETKQNAESDEAKSGVEDETADTEETAKAEFVTADAEFDDEDTVVFEEEEATAEIEAVAEASEKADETEETVKLPEEEVDEELADELRKAVEEAENN